MADFSAFVMPSCYAISSIALYNEGNGRGGIRTHGGLPHARFRVECLKPDSATLPPAKKQRRTLNVQHPTSNANAIREVERNADDPRGSCLTGGSFAEGVLMLRIRDNLAGRIVCLTTKKCYNFRLAKPAKRTASCVSTRTATLLLVVDRYSQVLGAAVHEYPQLIQN